LTQATDVDAHLSQKKARDNARQLAERPKKKGKKSVPRQGPGKAKIKGGSLKNQRKHSPGGINVAKKIHIAEAAVALIPGQIEKSKQKLWLLERDLHQAKVALNEAQKLRCLSSAGTPPLGPIESKSTK
jgi:hypothetical protein